jgi:hypothetical protein
VADDNSKRESSVKKYGVRIGGQIVLSLISRFIMFVFAIDIIILVFALATGGSFGGGGLAYYGTLVVDAALLPVLIYALIIIRRKRKQLRILPV